MDPTEGEHAKSLTASEIKRLGRIAEGLESKYGSGKWTMADQRMLEQIRLTLINDGQSKILLKGIDDLCLRGDALLARKHIEKGEIREATSHIDNLKKRLSDRFKQVLLIARMQDMGTYPISSTRERDAVRELWRLTNTLRDLYVALKTRDTHFVETAPQALIRPPPTLSSADVSQAGPVGEMEPISASEVNAALLSALMLDAWIGKRFGRIRSDLRGEVFDTVERTGSVEEREYVRSIRDVEALAAKQRGGSRFDSF